MTNSRRKEGEASQSKLATRSHQIVGGGSTGGQLNVKGSFTKRASEQKTITYPHRVKCKQ